MSDQEKADNILPLRAANANVPHEIAHPASKWYPEASDDPLADILFEFDDEQPESAQAEELDDFIYAHNTSQDVQITMSDSLSQMMAKISKQIKRLQEDTKRIKYYLDEVEDHLID